MITYEAEPFIEIHCGLSESPIWEEDTNVLRFVDIVGKAVFRVNLDEGPASIQKIQCEHSVSVTAELANVKDSFIFGGKYGVGISNKSGTEVKLLRKYWSGDDVASGKAERMRANDGAVDSKGRFWVSALCDPEETSFAPEAVLFRLDNDGRLNRVLSGLTIPNGMSWTNDNETLYFTDTQDSTIYAYDFDKESGSVSNKTIFFKSDNGAPDGHCQDEEGNLWVALWGAWKVVRVSPAGEVTAEVRVPTRCPTAVAFAGEDIYITSEAEHEPEKYPESLKHHGKVFKCHVGVKGQKKYSAKVNMDLDAIAE